MGRWRAVVAQIGIWTAAFAIGFPQPAFADDAGPRKDVRAVRYDLPRLIARQDFSTTGRTITIDAVAADGSGALAQWHDSDAQRIDYLVHRFDRWWIDREFYLDAPATNLLLTSAEVPKPLVALAVNTLPNVSDAGARPAKPVDDLRFSQEVQRPSTMGGYAMQVRVAGNDADSSAQIADVRGRPPTEAESWVTPGGNSYFFFSGTVQSSEPIHVAAGTTIDVWFPFVLDPSLYYGLTIAHTDKPIGPIDGTLKDNVVHFVLPAFTLQPGATLMGEIEGDSFRHES